MSQNSATMCHDGLGSRAALRTLEVLADAQLLERYIAADDTVAFEAIVRRYGPRVLRVCQQVLGHSADSEDAFQATFLVLARQARSIRKGESLGHWLHGVAHRVAVRSRARVKQRNAMERRAPMRLASGTAESDMNIEEMRRVLHEEIDQLPARLRVPILLCYMEGRTNEDAARILGCPSGTLKDRLVRGRERLRQRLSRRGMALTAFLLLLLLPGRAPASHISSELVRATILTITRGRRFGLRIRRQGPSGGPRLLLIAWGASSLLALGAAIALAAPPPKRGTWLAWLIEASRQLCH